MCSRIHFTKHEKAGKIFLNVEKNVHLTNYYQNKNGDRIYKLRPTSKLYLLEGAKNLRVKSIMIILLNCYEEKYQNEKDQGDYDQNEKDHEKMNRLFFGTVSEPMTIELR